MPKNSKTLTGDIVCSFLSDTEGHRRLDVRGAGGSKLMACASHEAELMPLFSIRLRNSEYYSHDDNAEYDNAEAALASGVHSAMRMATDEIASGHRNAAIEIIIKGDDGMHLMNFVVAISVSPLMIDTELVSEHLRTTD